MKKAIAILLTLTLAISLALPALAADEAVPHYESYVSIGDSIPAGTGAPTYHTGVIEWTDDTYPVMVRDAVKANPSMDVSYPGAHCGMRVREMLIGLTHDESYADSYTYDFFATDLWANPQALQTMLNTPYADAIARADLITIEFGSNELMGVLLYHLIDLVSSLPIGNGLAELLTGAVEEAETAETAEDAVSTLLKALTIVYNTPQALAEILTKLSENIMNNGIYQFNNTWDDLMGRILDINGGKADIVVLGVYNPLRSMMKGMIGEGVLTDVLEDFVQKLVDAINYTMKYGSAYRDKYVFADTSELVPLLVAGHTVDGTHPDVVGHEKLAEIVLNALKKFCKHEHTIRLFEKKATLFEKGYTGDVVCSDCGVLLEQGTVVDILGRKTEIAKGIGYAVAESVITSTAKAVSTVFSKLFAK